MTDRFQTLTPSLTGPASAGFPILPADGTDLPEITRAIYVGSSGDIFLTLQDGTSLSFKAVAAGSFLPLRARAVASTGTTAGDMIGLV